MFAADLYCHKYCYENYIGKWNRATSTPNTSKTKMDIFKNYFSFIKSIIDQGRGFSLSDIRGTINQDDDANLRNNEIKGFLIEEFGDFISIYDPERKNQPLFAFSCFRHYLMLTLDLKIASVMHTSSSNLGKKQKFWTFFSRFLQLCLMSVVPN